VLYSTVYGKATDFAVDPIEKKPLYHFYPGTDVLSFGTIGCNLGCKFCQNWITSKSADEDQLQVSITAREIILLAKENNCIGIAYTYNEPTIFSEWIIEIAQQARLKNLKNILVTNGFINPDARMSLFEYVDAVNIDLKSISDKFYKKLTLSKLEPVLDSLKWLYNETDAWIEITNLIIPGENDSNSEVERLTEFVSSELDADIPLHFSAFHPDYKLLNIPVTPLATLERACSIAERNGLKNVYCGNVLISSHQNTTCKNCRQTVIERNLYNISWTNMDGSDCRSCGNRIAGVFN
jgi:pyruvate formate lyase activating enzyme